MECGHPDNLVSFAQVVRYLSLTFLLPHHYNAGKGDVVCSARRLEKWHFEKLICLTRHSIKICIFFTFILTDLKTDYWSSTDSIRQFNQQYELLNAHTSFTQPRISPTLVQLVSSALFLVVFACSNPFSVASWDCPTCCVLWHVMLGHAVCVAVLRWDRGRELSAGLADVWLQLLLHFLTEEELGWQPAGLYTERRWPCHHQQQTGTGTFLFSYTTTCLQLCYFLFRGKQSEVYL